MRSHSSKNRQMNAEAAFATISLAEREAEKFNLCKNEIIYSYYYILE